jgi:predicted nuclease of restriction endonuclease-like (RecB) superfamily
MGFAKYLEDDLSRFYQQATAFPDMKGYSSLMYMRAFAEAWPDAEIVQQAAGQLPWGNNLVLLTKLKDVQHRLAYTQRAIEHGWSRNMLGIHIETRLLEREGDAVTNFVERLPSPQSDLATTRSRIPTARSAGGRDGAVPGAWADGELAEERVFTYW